MDHSPTNDRIIVETMIDRIKWLNEYGKNVFSPQYIKDVTAELKTILETKN
jgi:hypothetical protein